MGIRGRASAYTFDRCQNALHIRFRRSTLESPVNHRPIATVQKRATGSRTLAPRFKYEISVCQCWCGRRAAERRKFLSFVRERLTEKDRNNQDGRPDDKRRIRSRISRAQFGHHGIFVQHQYERTVADRCPRMQSSSRSMRWRNPESSDPESSRGTRSVDMMQSIQFPGIAPVVEQLRTSRATGSTGILLDPRRAPMEID